MPVQHQAITFGIWLSLTLELLAKRFDIWVVYLFLSTVLLAVGRISLGLSIFLSVSCLFVGVSIAEYIDTGTLQYRSSGLSGIIREKMPLIMSLAIMVAMCWFAFRVIYNIYIGEYAKILQFFFHWELHSDNYAGKNLRQMTAWLYSSAIVALLLVLMLLGSYASWFSYPLMAYKKLNWVQAKRAGHLMSKANKTAMRQLSAFIVLLALPGLGLVPLLTPAVYILISTLMYVSYKTCLD